MTPTDREVDARLRSGGAGLRSATRMVAPSGPREKVSASRGRLLPGALVAAVVVSGLGVALAAGRGGDEARVDTAGAGPVVPRTATARLRGVASIGPWAVWREPGAAGRVCAAVDAPVWRRDSCLGYSDLPISDYPGSYPFGLLGDSAGETLLVFGEMPDGAVGVRVDPAELAVDGGLTVAADEGLFVLEQDHGATGVATFVDEAGEEVHSINLGTGPVLVG